MSDTQWRERVSPQRGGMFSVGPESPTHTAGAAQRQNERIHYLLRTRPPRRLLEARRRAPAELHAAALFPSVGAREKRFFKAILYVPGPVGTSISTPHPSVSPSFIYPKA